jgi:hypothetical protein
VNAGSVIAIRRSSHAVDSMLTAQGADSLGRNTGSINLLEEPQVGST